MKIKDKFIKIILALWLGVMAISLISISNNCVTNPSLEKDLGVCVNTQTHQSPGARPSDISVFGITKSNLLGYLFQIMFILFFISPPIIAVMLFLIWKELKERNKMK
jgi:hypothetical protein